MLVKKKFKFLLTLFCCNIIIFLSAFNVVQATTWTVEKDRTLYGDLNQNLIPGIGSMACGPTAAVNSFVYLENQYSDIYGHNLIPDSNGDGIYHDTNDLITVAQILAGSNYMNMDMTNGTFADNFIYGKYAYIEDNAPGTTTYQAQNFWDWSRPPVDQPDWVDQTTPTWEFLYNELAACEDVEILINGDFNHYLTLTSLSWDDVTNIGTIDYIDPLTGAWGESNILLGPSAIGNSSLITDYRSGNSYISMAVKESPVPEPSTILLMGIGLLGFACRLRKKSA